ncbi:unnamed protein product [Mucor hiemalis]
MQEPFDILVHSGSNFIEVLSTHFLNMVESPRSPMQRQQLERNVAFFTTIPILHNLFLGCNDVIDIQIPLTSEVKKWDGVAFVVKKKILPLCSWSSLVALIATVEQKMQEAIRRR